jgi:hypothetical protein
LHNVARFLAKIVGMGLLVVVEEGGDAHEGGEGGGGIHHNHVGDVEASKPYN